jgi:HK97 gp10 family phage protein
MNSLESFLGDLKTVINGTAEVSLENTAKQICKDMKSTVPVDTGKLKRSIHQKTERTNESTVTAYIYADAKNKQNGAQYAKFVEYGTGLYNINGNGRQTPWRYKDSKGNWHTTSGQMPQAFINPSVRANLPETLEKQIRKNISKYFKEGH